MRLNEKETASIREILRGADPAGKIILFGSRADDDRRGGDIDLFFESSRPMSLREKLLLEYRLSSTLDTKVDLLVKPAQEADRPIHRAARKGAPL